MRKNKKLVRHIVCAADVAAIYVVLTAISGVLGLSNGVIQLRISDALCVLPIFMPSATVGLFIGCLLSNLMFSGGVVLDIILGSIATLIGALGARALRELPDRLIWLATLPTVIANALIIPPILIFAYGAEGSYPFMLLTVTLGELISATLCGTFLYFRIKRLKLNLK